MWMQKACHKASQLFEFYLWEKSFFCQEIMIWTWKLLATTQIYATCQETFFLFSLLLFLDLTLNLDIFFFKKHSVVVQCLFIGVFSFVLFIFFSASWQEIASMVFLFSKIANFVLFARSDLRLGLIYLIICIGEWLEVHFCFFFKN